MARRLGRRFAALAACVGLAVVVLTLLQAGLEARDRASLAQAGQRVPVGDLSLHLRCSGTGSPTIVLISGVGDLAVHWERVQEPLSEHYRVCSYDRPGLGGSDRSAEYLDLPGQVALLDDLLRVAGEQPPFILVGHSIGGVMARRLAAQMGTRVAGVVLVDSSVEGQPVSAARSGFGVQIDGALCRAAASVGLPRWLGYGRKQADAFPRLSAAARATVEASAHQRRRCESMDRETRMALAALRTGRVDTLGSLPLVVISRGGGSEPSDVAWRRLQQGLVGLSTLGAHVTAQRSGHYVQISEPELVVEAVRTVDSTRR